MAGAYQSEVPRNFSRLCPPFWMTSSNVQKVIKIRMRSETWKKTCLIQLSAMYPLMMLGYQTSPVLTIMTSSNGNIFRVTGPLWGESTGGGGGGGGWVGGWVGWGWGGGGVGVGGGGGGGGGIITNLTLRNHRVYITDVSKYHNAGIWSMD